jgi:hypothetical protein
MSFQNRVTRSARCTLHAAKQSQDASEQNQRQLVSKLANRSYTSSGKNLTLRYFGPSLRNAHACFSEQYQPNF